ncbi:MAG: hypothetical protein ETSY2_31980 [Candidatus Entotheonella gemina]|uniref:Aldehyde oxidase/xanthine dehydrogenase a/b hammerhead domain-containing protein n=1 Tax=Candidatus Entotheonella gemina TaxID=1429439 RepID=W4M0N9_9BACT|nr:MAG: hypothetical protein ETSY2_31980 [Candidatus Entotheonella gemina]
MDTAAPLATVYTEGKRVFDLQAQYIADLQPVPNLHHAAILRSPYAHARIRHIDVSAATALPGVVSVLTGRDVAEWCRPFAVAAERPGRYYPVWHRQSALCRGARGRSRSDGPLRGRGCPGAHRHRVRAPARDH